MRRGKGDQRALGAAIDALRAGGLVAMAPEGRVGTGNELQRGHTGAARIALSAGTPIVAAAVWGTQRRWPQAGLRSGRPLRPNVAVAYGPPVRLEGDPSSPADVTAATARIMDALAEQVGVARRLAP